MQALITAHACLQRQSFLNLLMHQQHAYGLPLPASLLRLCHMLSLLC